MQKGQHFHELKFALTLNYKSVAELLLSKGQLILMDLTGCLSSICRSTKWATHYFLSKIRKFRCQKSMQHSKFYYLG